MTPHYRLAKNHYKILAEVNESTVNSPKIKSKIKIIPLSTVVTLKATMVKMQVKYNYFVVRMTKHIYLFPYSLSSYN